MQAEFDKASSKKKPNIKTVAAAAGVSTATVSNAFNRPDQLSPKVRERVLTIARELGYSGANPVARNLRRMSTNTIGFVYRESLEFGINDPASQQFLQGIARALESRGLGLLLLPYSATANSETVRNAAVDGIILYCPPINTPLVQVVKDRRLPAVFVDYPTRPDCTTVRVRDRSGARPGRASDPTRAQTLRHYQQPAHGRFSRRLQRLESPRTRFLLSGKRALDWLSSCPGRG
jgi:DNA-binding LacI/PurR family transcriptional regulator